MPESFQRKHQETIRSAEMTLCLSEFSIPPMQDTLLIGRKAAIGPAAAKRMADALSPNDYEIIPLDSPVFEAALVKKSLLHLIPKEKLLPILLEEGERLGGQSALLKAKVQTVIKVKRGVDL